ncbi:hypothetical protein BO221_07965 [Archangium sp. Cb G35]|nr:hypothetical protein BO221_07965 [Archangium sp. Cb G35]
MIGAITPNFRRVTLALTSHNAVCLRFVLERDDPNDREEVDDIAFEFQALQTQGIELDVKVIVDARPIHELALPGRLVFGRKEQ